MPVPYFGGRKARVLCGEARIIGPSDRAPVYARPDDLCESGKPWRDVLLEYNKQPRNNPLGLSPAYRLYENLAYRRLVEAFGGASVFILSAGWGSIGAEFRRSGPWGLAP
jgi:hypothetical protein